MVTTRLLTPSDQPALEAYLWQRPETAMLLLGNLEEVGLGQGGHRHNGDYVAAFDDAGAIQACMVYYNRGMILFQAESDEAFLACLATLTQKNPERVIVGFIGEDRFSQLLIDASQWQKSIDRQTREVLYKLPLADLRFPEMADQQGIELRQASEADMARLLEWNTGYDAELFGKDTSTQEYKEDSLNKMLNNRRWILSHHGEDVAMCAFNAEAGDMVQLGSVYTPKHLRGKGYARTVIACALRHARDVDGKETAILFTDTPSAVRAYEAIGFEKIGALAMVFLKDNTTITLSDTVTIRRSA